MKKIFTLFIAAAMAATELALPIHAETHVSFGIESDTRGPEELNSIIDEIRQEALPRLNVPLGDKDIDLSRAEKIYEIKSAEDLPLTCLSKEEAIRYLEKCGYFWMLPTTAGGKTIELGIDRECILPDTTDVPENGYYQNCSGKWEIFCTEIPLYGNELITRQEVAKGMARRQQGLAGQDWDAVMVYGMYGTMGYGALLMSEDSVEYLMPLSPPMGMEIPEGYMPERFLDYDGMLLPFSDLQEMIDNYQVPEPNGLINGGKKMFGELSAEAGCQDKEELLGF